MLTIHLETEGATLQLAARLAAHMRAGCNLYLSGQLGAGKTTFVRGFLRGLGYGGKVKSPTYTLIEPYELEHLTIYHGDLYRIKSVAELEGIGIFEYLSASSICIIEWPEKGEPLLPLPDILCRFDIVQGKRQITLIAYSELGQHILIDMGNVHE